MKIAALSALSGIIARKLPPSLPHLMKSMRSCDSSLHLRAEWETDPHYRGTRSGHRRKTTVADVKRLVAVRRDLGASEHKSGSQFQLHISDWKLRISCIGRSRSTG